MNIKGDIFIVYSRGVQMGSSTEYTEYKHEVRRRKKWVKVHVITDGERMCRQKRAEAAF